MNQLTAVQKLVQTIEFWQITIDCPNLFNAICEQAIELEKQQIINAYNAGFNEAVYELNCKSSIEYFNENFDKN
jgi:hypothetical protein